MKVVETILTVFMVVLGLSLVLAYSVEGKPFLATLWAVVACVNVSSLTLSAVTVLARKAWQ